MGWLNSGNRQGVSVSTVVDDVSGRLQHLPVFVPRDLGLGGGVDDADDLRLVAFRRVDEGLLVLDFRGV